MDFSQFLDYIKITIEGLCPIMSTTNMQRRATDDDPSSAIKSILVRTAASAAVAIILGIASGLASSYIMVLVMEKQLIATDKRIDRIEGRVNNHMDNPVLHK